MATSTVIQASSQNPAQNGAGASAQGTNAAFGTNFALGGLLNDISSLSIANGMTAGYGDNDGNIDNPAAWPGTYGGNPATSPNRIGVMRNLPNSLPPGPNTPEGVYSLYFIFNPNQIVAQFGINTGSLPSLYLYGSDSSTNISSEGTASNPGSLTNSSSSFAGSVPNLTNSQTISWSLIFDRTYDMLFDTNPDDNRGVLKDVAALYNIMGSFEGQSGVPISTPVQVVFAQTISGQLWGFTGYISSVTITYGIFRRNMIPSRCEVDLQMTTTYVASQSPAVTTPSSSPGASGAAASGAALTAAGSTSVNGTLLTSGR